MSVSDKTPNPIDRHVGARLRMRRVAVKMSQGKLGEALDVTFQQIQKYEKGANRVSASKLQQIARVLNVPPSFFFDGAPSGGVNAPPGFAEPDSESYLAEFLSTNEGVQLNRAFARIRDPAVRRRVVELVSTLADQQK